MTTPAMPANISTDDSVVASPEPGRPSAGKPRLPYIRHQLAKTLKATAENTMISAQRGRSSAEMNERRTR